MIQTANLLNSLSPYSIVIYMLVLTRITGLMVSAPFFSTIQAPVMTKIWFSGIIAFIFFPLVQASKSFILPHDMAEFIILMLIEFAVGYLIGFIANLILEGVRMAGSIISIQTGLSMSEALDPATGVQSNELSRIYIYLATLIFLMTGAYQMLFMVVYSSFSAIPMGAFPVFSPDIVNSIIQLSSQVFKVSFGVAFPIFSVLLIVDILLGMMSKMMPQMNIYMVALPVKIYIGLFLIAAFLSATSIYMQEVIKGYMQAIYRLFT